MNLFQDQISAAGTRQLEAQLHFMRSATGNAFDSAEKLFALHFDVTRQTLEKSSALLRQVTQAKDPRDFLALASQTQSQFDSMLAYPRRLFGIATAMSGAIVGLPPAVTPAASAALQKLASLPALADDIVVQTVQVVEELAEPVDQDEPAGQAGSGAQQRPAMAAGARDAADAAEAADDDIIEQTNLVVEAFAEESEQELQQPLEAPTAAPAPAEPIAETIAEPIGELKAVAASAGHATPRASSAPFTVDASNEPIEVQPAAAPVNKVNTAKPAGRARKK